MKKINKRVLNMVRRELDRNPTAKSGDLYEKAKKLDRAIGSLSVRQFHAQYPLQIKRLRKLAARSGRPGPARRSRSVRSGKRATARRPSPARRPAAPRSAEKPADAPASAPSASNHVAVREVLVEFASAVARADDKADMIGVMRELDSWVDRIVEAA